MREATGGVLLLQLVIVILTIFVFFIASVMQYTRVYRIKGTVINAIERSEGGIRDQEEFEKVLGTAGYDGPYKLCKCQSNSKGTFYTLEIYAAFTMLPQFVSIAVPIRGNTRSIESGIFYRSDQTELFGASASSTDESCGSNTTTKVCITR